MAEQSDEVGISISGALDAATNSGAISAQTKSRFLGAADRLLGSLFDLPAAWVDSVTSRVKSEAAIKREFREHQAALAKEALERNDEKEARLAQLRAAAELRELEHTLNLAAVVSEAAGILRDEDESARSSPKKETSGDLEDDWLGRFRHFAKEASSVELRSLWARVLAGEVGDPGSNSAATLRFMFELDKTLAQHCEYVSARRVGDAIYPDEADKTGEGLEAALAADVAGLISGVGRDITHSFNKRSDNKFFVRSQDWALQCEATEASKIALEVWPVTRLGREIFTLLQAPDSVDNLKRLAALFDASSVPTITLYKLGDKTDDGGYKTISTELLRDSPPQEY